MESYSLLFSFFLAVLLSFSSAKALTVHSDVPTIEDAAKRRTYIVHLRPPDNSTITRFEDLTNWYKSFLPQTTTNSSDFRFMYAYSEAITGFAANLTEYEVRDMEQKDGFLKAHHDYMLPLLTTHTPEFLGLPADNGPWKSSGMGKGIIIGVLDTGIKDDHPSFDDEGMPSPPSKWKGGCDLNFKCNNKLIGAARFHNGPKLDLVRINKYGHGTHTASTAAGNFVENASVLGNGNGTATGMAPRAHLSLYQVCSNLGCFASDVLAGMDAAIKDGVDVLSLSLGIDSSPFDRDEIAIGAFSAIKKGIFVSCSAGNSGPARSTVSNEAPWILTVGASTMDRKIKAIVKLGDGQELEGESLFQPPDFPSTMIPLVYPTIGGDGNCDYDTLNQSTVKGKIVACESLQSGDYSDTVVKEAGGVAIIILNKKSEGDTVLAETYTIPASHVGYRDATKLRNYVKSADKLSASISFNGTCIGTSPAPVIAYFSSRGPSLQSPGILKPDIVGPGVNVLAAWHLHVGPSSKRSSANANFNIISGTSMSAPHLSGIAALIKSAHPDWSPAAIKSAIMTTADTTGSNNTKIADETLNSASVFAMGAGHVNASKAMNPGLVYDIAVEDYIAYLCGLGYEDKKVELITHQKVACSKIAKIEDVELNYPSIAVNRKLGKLSVNRTVTNVGEGYSKYTVQINMPGRISVNVSPRILKFSAIKEKKSFLVSLSWHPDEVADAEGNILWVSKKHVVRSPIVISCS